MILSGAGLVEPTKDKPVYVHNTETIDISELKVSDGNLRIPLSAEPYLPGDGNANYAYVMLKKDGEFVSEPYIPFHGEDSVTEGTDDEAGTYYIFVGGHEVYDAATLSDDGSTTTHTPEAYTVDSNLILNDEPNSLVYDSVLVDYYVAHESDGTQQIEITPDKFGGNFYLEASTLFRTEKGIDVPAEFIIPNCKIQSNFTFTMASSGDPSSFTFTMDAFPDYTRFDHSKKVLAVLQTVKDASSSDLHRHSTVHETDHDLLSW